MDIAIVQNNTIVSIGDYRTVFPNTSFAIDGPSDEFLIENSAKRVNLFKDYDSATQCIEQCEPYIEGEWVYKVAVRDLTAQELQMLKDRAMTVIRVQRNQLLAVSDWTQLVDTPIEIKTAWAEYRQQLRDLPSTITEPATFSDWPHDPNWVEQK